MNSPCSFAKWLKNQNVTENSEIHEIAKVELERMVKQPGNFEPNRGDLDDPTIEWRSGKPDYTLANLAFLKGKCMSHDRESLEMIVQNAVKTWEMEASHKVNTSQWKSIIHDKYNVQANNNKKFYLKEAAERGNYNVLMDHVDKSLYNSGNESFESSHHLFQNAFGGTFPWEVLEVFAGPPNIAFSWRHWGEFTGEYEGNIGDGGLVQMTGFACVSVTKELKITDIKIYYRPEDFLRVLQGKKREELMDNLKSQNIKNLIQNMSTKDFKLEVNGKADESGQNLLKRFQTSSTFKVNQVFSEGSETSFSWQIQRESENDEKELNGFAILNCNEKNEVASGSIYHK